MPFEVNFSYEVTYVYEDLTDMGPFGGYPCPGTSVFDSIDQAVEFFKPMIEDGTFCYIEEVYPAEGHPLLDEQCNAIYNELQSRLGLN